MYLYSGCCNQDSFKAAILITGTKMLTIKMIGIAFLFESEFLHGKMGKMLTSI